MESRENTYTRAILSKFMADSNELLKIGEKDNNPIHAHFAGITHRTLTGLDPRINPNKPPRNFRDTMKALDKQAWAAPYNSEFLGFPQREVFKVVRPEPGVRIDETLTKLEYKTMVSFSNARYTCAQEGISRLRELASKNPNSMHLS